MAVWGKITRSNFLIRLKSWEYWPFGIVQFPAILYWVWLSLRARSFVFFSASNPGIPMGGMFGESKYELLKRRLTVTHNEQHFLPDDGDDAAARFIWHAHIEDSELEIFVYEILREEGNRNLF